MDAVLAPRAPSFWGPATAAPRPLLGRCTLHGGLHQSLPRFPRQDHSCIHTHQLPLRDEGVSLSRPPGHVPHRRAVADQTWGRSLSSSQASGPAVTLAEGGDHPATAPPQRASGPEARPPWSQPTGLTFGRPVLLSSWLMSYTGREHSSVLSITLRATSPWCPVVCGLPGTFGKCQGGSF